jgi:Dolichyl-phosphate-mannose-protein mannosyltransferase
MSLSASLPRRDLLLVYVGALALFVASGFLIDSPGYMDAEYYLTTGGELAAGRGFQEPFLWNFLDDPQELPHPSHRYWMPLATVVAAIGRGIGGEAFRGTQIPFLVIAAALPVLAYVAAWRLYRDRQRAWSAGSLALFPGLLFPFLLTTDTFGLYGLLAGAALLAISSAARSRWPFLGAGVLVGMAHLTRADGILLWVPLMFALKEQRGRRSALILTALLGYLIVLAAWVVRNQVDTGDVWPLGGGRALWLLSYDDTFSYPGGLLTPQRWLSAGWTHLLSDRLNALLTNLRSLLVVNGLVFLAPLMIVGAWRRRSEPIVRSAAVYLAVLLAAMSLVFPYAGARGGFFHSSTAIQPILLALVPQGLEALVGWGARVRRWEPLRAQRLFFPTLLGLAVAFTAWATWSRVTGDGMGAGWERNARTYSAVEPMIPSPSGRVAVNDPPGLYAAAGLPGVVIPNGLPETLHSVVERFDVDWVLLEVNHPKGLNEMYAHPEANDFLETPLRMTDANGEPMYLFRVKP